MIQGHQKWYSGLSNTQIHKYKDTNTQIHCDEVPEIPNMCHIFEKPGVQGHQKWYSELPKIQIHRRCDNYVSPNLKLWTTDPLTDFCTVPPGLSLQHSTFCTPGQETWDHQEGGRKILAAGAQREIWKISYSCGGRGKILEELFNNPYSAGVYFLTLRKLLLQLLQTLDNVI